MPAIEFRAITKRFPGVVALHGVTLGIASGSCHALVGENGAGKSTLGKILAGIQPADEGTILLDGAPVRFDAPDDAISAGIGMVHQELSFCENMTVAENLCLGRMPATLGFVARGRMHGQAAGMLAEIGADIDPGRRLGELPIGQQQMIQIAGAVSRGANVLVFDEPTSSLTQVESERLFALIRRLLARGVTAIYVSHRLDEIFSLCDTISVLRDGDLIASRPTPEWTEPTLVAAMIGRAVTQRTPEHIRKPPGEERLAIESLSSPGKFSNISLRVHAGEVVGLAGLVGAGRTELTEAIFGLDPAASGRIRIHGQDVRIRSPRDAMQRGLGLIPEDRKRHGLVLPMSAGENITLPSLGDHSTLGWIHRPAEQAAIQTFFERLRVRAPGHDTRAAGLSGGNQQKLVIAKWMAMNCGILLIDEPTRGVDVGAKAEIHALIDELTTRGAGVLLVSSELPELLNLSTRILVLRHGRQVAEFDRTTASQTALLRAMAGLAHLSHNGEAP